MVGKKKMMVVKGLSCDEKGDRPDFNSVWCQGDLSEPRALSK